MKVYTYSEARQKLAQLLDEAREFGKVLIRRRDGSVFSLAPEPLARSPFDVAGIETGITSDEIVAFVREGREQSFVVPATDDTDAHR